MDNSEEEVKARPKAKGKRRLPPNQSVIMVTCPKCFKDEDCSCRCRKCNNKKDSPCNCPNCPVCKQTSFRCLCGNCIKCGKSQYDPCNCGYCPECGDHSKRCACYHDPCKKRYVICSHCRICGRTRPCTFNCCLKCSESAANCTCRVGGCVQCNQPAGACICSLILKLAGQAGIGAGQPQLKQLDPTNITKLVRPMDYMIWSNQVKTAISTAGILDILVKDTPPAPVNGDSDPVKAAKTAAREDFAMKSSIIRDLINKTISQQYNLQVVNMKTAKAVWEHLKNACMATDPINYQMVEIKYAGYKPRKDLSGVKIFDDLHAIFQELKVSGKAPSEEQFCTKVVMTLPQRFEAMSAVYFDQPNRDPADLRKRLAREDARYALQRGEELETEKSKNKSREKGEKSGHAMALQDSRPKNSAKNFKGKHAPDKQGRSDPNQKMKWRGDHVCFKCNEKGHIAVNCPNADEEGNNASQQQRRSNGVTSQVQCQLCDKSGHTARSCSRLSQFRGKGNGNSGN